MNLRSLTRSAIANGASLFIRIAISYLLTPFLINYLGKEQYGVWMILVTFTLSGSLSFFTFGFQGALIKYVAEHHALKQFRKLNEVFSATFLFYMAMALVCSIAVTIFAKFYLLNVFNIPAAEISTAQVIMYIFAVMVIFELPALAISAIIEGLQRYDMLAMLDVGRILAFSGAVLAILLSGHGLKAIALAMLFSTLAYAVAMAICAKRLVPACRVVIGGDKQTLRELFVFTRDLFILRINGLIYNNMDKMIIGVLLSTTFVTDYDIANRIHALALTVMGLAPSVVLPAASALDAANDKERSKQLLLKGSKYSTAMTLPFVIVLFILAEGLIRFWISPEYIHVALYARLFLLYLLFWPIIQVGWNMLVGVNKVRSIVPLQTFSVGVNLVISIVLVNYIGVAGTMIGTIVANLLIFFAYLRLISNTFGVTIGEFVKTVVVPAYSLGAVLALLLYSFASVVPAKSLVQVGAYMLMSLLLYYSAFFVFCIAEEERIKFRSIFGKIGK